MGTEIHVAPCCRLDRFFSAGARAALLVLAPSMVLTACTSPSGSGAESTWHQAQHEQIVRMGTVEAVRPVIIAQDRTRSVGVVADGLEITVRLNNGETRVIAQAADVAINAGQRVRLVRGSESTRVVPGWW